jgi:hypothetical protein
MIASKLFSLIRLSLPQIADLATSDTKKDCIEGTKKLWSASKHIENRANCSYLPPTYYLSKKASSKICD